MHNFIKIYLKYKIVKKKLKATSKLIKSKCNTAYSETELTKYSTQNHM